jgi:hypothetical protein
LAIPAFALAMSEECKVRLLGRRQVVRRCELAIPAFALAIAVGMKEGYWGVAKW